MEKQILDNKPRKLEKQNGRLTGVCGGIGHYLGIDATIIRLVFIGLMIPGGLPGIIPYFILWLVMPRAKGKK